MPVRTGGKALKKHGNDLNSSYVSQERNCYEGGNLTSLLQSIRREIESARLLDGSSLPGKIWLKQQFSIGVNDVTRVLEHTTPCTKLGCSPQLPPIIGSNRRAPSVKLQAVLVASDCNPRWLTKHLLNLASSRKVPLILVKDNKQGSLRLGELVNLKTAIAVGVKDRGSSINKFFGEILGGHENNIGPDLPKFAGISDVESDIQEPDTQDMQIAIHRFQ